ncbi:hypothetical protein GXW74_00830 [Roseomonas eburnea]|uniref:Lipoprotein n=1 Tax=Neoroseomonas eburnea TaxID=1346889 RepID=A0A9X9X5N0_9PROT|nr:hypothetical protein [Neoroseomonas eburnea]MBR0679016.1 hypothetical protein [Neoroseomonas eburnea]
MRTNIAAFPAGFLLLLVAGCAAVPEPASAPAPGAAASRDVPQVVGGRRLTGAEFRQMVFGNTLDRRLPNGSRLLVYIAADGSQRLRLTGVQGQRASDRGTVSIRGDEVCSRWERIAGGRDTCFAYFQLGQSLVAIDVEGEISPTRFELQRGNPEGV